MDAPAWIPSGQQWAVAHDTGLPPVRDPPQWHHHHRLDLHHRYLACRVRLDADHTSRAGTVMGHGSGPTGTYGLAGTGLLAVDPPDFPNTSASDVIMPNDTDASTDSGDGIAVWQTRASDLGYRFAVDGRMDATDAALQSIRLPIAVRPAVEPKLYSSVGAVIGDNPDPAPGLHLA